MKDIELRLIAELMKNSRRSDRDLAKTLRVSQPTVTRVRSRLEREGYLKEYTAIPDFAKLGYELAAITLVRVNDDLTEEELKQAQQITQKDMAKKAPSEIILFERGLGEKYTGAIVSYHKSYSEYSELLRRMKEYPFLNCSETLSFIVNLNDRIHYRNFTLSTIAEHLANSEKKQ